MKRIQYYSYGGPETMKLEAFELKAPGTGEVARLKPGTSSPERLW